MALFYDDNYGWWEMEDADDYEHYRRTQRDSVMKKCKGCGKRVKILPQYAYCNTCATKIEQGWDL